MSDATKRDSATKRSGWTVAWDWLTMLAFTAGAIALVIHGAGEDADLWERLRHLGSAWGLLAWAARAKDRLDGDEE
jgi:hypothetical protein